MEYPYLCCHNISNKHSDDIKVVTDVIDNAVIKRTYLLYHSKDRSRKQYLHLCLDREHTTLDIEKEIIKRGYVHHLPYKRKRGQKEEKKTYPQRNTIPLKIKDGL